MSNSNLKKTITDSKAKPTKKTTDSKAKSTKKTTTKKSKTTKVKNSMKMPESHCWSFGYGVCKIFIPKLFVNDFEKFIKKSNYNILADAHYQYELAMIKKKKVSNHDLQFNEGRDYIFKTELKQPLVAWLKDMYRNIEKPTVTVKETKEKKIKC
jgi:hypothetical protein